MKRGEVLLAVFLELIQLKKCKALIFKILFRKGTVFFRPSYCSTLLIWHTYYLYGI